MQANQNEPENLNKKNIASIKVFFEDRKSAADGRAYQDILIYIIDLLAEKKQRNEDERRRKLTVS